MKADHERRFSAPDRAILDTLKDWTELDVLRTPQNLARLDRALGWNHSPGELKEVLGELTEFLGRFKDVPMELRIFLGAVASRALKMSETRVVQTGIGGTKILVSDLRDAFRLSERSIVERISELDGYGLADLDTIDTDLGLKPALQILDLKSGWPLWLDIALFCEVESEPMEAFSRGLEFDRFDD